MTSLLSSMMASPSSSSSSSSSSCSSKKLFCIIFLVFLGTASSSFPSIGVSMNPSAPGVPSSDLIVSAIGSAGIHHVLLQDPDVKTLRSFLYTNISLLISLHLSRSTSNNSYSYSYSYTHAHQWISTHILPFHPRIHVSAISISIGTPTPTPANNNINISSSQLVLLSLRNFRSACIELGLPNIPISTVHSFHVLLLLRPMMSPSSARFQQDLLPLLEFLNSTGSPFLVDLYPFHLYRTNPAAVPIGYVLFLIGKEDNFNFFFFTDEVTGLRYRNMFDSMVDALITALEKTGYGHLPLVVTGTGWPTAGAQCATSNYSFLYNTGLVEHLRFGLGTPMRREGVKAVYLHDLFDDATKTTTTTTRHGEPASWESHWGIWFANLTHKYEIDFSSSSASSSPPQETGLWAKVRLSSCLLLLATSLLIS